MARALYQKLGITAYKSISVINRPPNFNDLFTDVPFTLKWVRPFQGVDYIHFFPKDLAELEEGLPNYQETMDKNGTIWVSWFKNASKIATDLNEDIIRETALNLKLVDVKVCSVNDHYSALKLVIRKHLR